MKLLIVTQKVDRDDQNLGAFYYWFQEFARACDRVVILSVALPAGQVPGRTRVYSFGAPTRPGRIWKFWELFSREYAECDAVLFHQIPEFVLAASPFLLSLKKPSGLWYAHKSVSWRLNIAEKFVRYVFTSSQEGLRMPSKKAIWTGQAINTDLFAPATRDKRQETGDTRHLTSDSLRLITVGRIAPIKNYEIMIDALAMLTSAFSKPWIFDIVGGPLAAPDAEYLCLLKKKIDDAGLAPRIRFLGPRPYSEIPGLLQAHDIFINMSQTGSLDKAVLEAMSCGLCVMTANEAYRAVLPAKYFLPIVNAEALAERIATLADENRPVSVLRDIVLQDHSLGRTIEKILFALKQ